MSNASTEEATRKMDRKLKAKWLRALRSGKIKQARCVLLDSVGAMCCIGVLGRVCGISDHDLYENRWSVAGHPLERIEEAIWDHGAVSKLTSMNDGHSDGRREIKPQSFKQIALWIERNL